MTVAEAAREIGLSADAVYDLCRSGLLPHRRIGPSRGRIQIDASHIAVYLARSEVTETNAPGAPEMKPVKAPPRLREGRPDGKPFRFAK